MQDPAEKLSLQVARMLNRAPRRLEWTIDSAIVQFTHAGTMVTVLRESRLITLQSTHIVNNLISNLITSGMYVNNELTHSTVFTCYCLLVQTGGSQVHPLVYVTLSSCLH